MRALVWLLFGVFAALALVRWEQREQAPALAEGPGLEVATVLAQGGEAYEPVAGPVELGFPRDHGPHPDFRNEWWYLTGNLRDADGRRFGYQLTFFRRALTPRAARLERESAFASDQLYMAHLAVSDLENDRIYAAERLSRAGSGLAGSRSAPLEVWLEDWQLRAAAGAGFEASLRAQHADAAIELRVRALRPLVLQGERGYSRKSADGASASHYYSITRLATEGELRIGERRFRVSGQSWLDREWSSQGLAEGQSGWDWFALQLSDGRDLMWYQLRDLQGGRSYASGILVETDGSSTLLGPEALEVRVLDYWQSRSSGVRYPSAWQLRLTDGELELEVSPRAPSQELELAFRYWEGAVEVQGRSGPNAVSGQGYVELTGYGQPRNFAYPASRSPLHSP